MDISFKTHSKQYSIEIRFGLVCVGAVIPTTSPVTQNEIAAEGTDETQAALIIAKRQAPEIPAEGNCMIYRYGSFSSTLDVAREFHPS